MAQEARIRKRNAVYQAATVRKASGVNLGAKKTESKAALSKTAIYVLLFVVLGGVVFELLRLILLPDPLQALRTAATGEE